MNLYDVEFKIKGNPHLQSAMPIAKNMKEVRSQFKQMAGVKIVKIIPSPFGKEIIAEIQKQQSVK